jgi:hypothetical protein
MSGGECEREAGVEDPAVEESVARFVELDDQAKAEKLIAKRRKDLIKGHKQTIITYMVNNRIDRAWILNKTQYLECLQKTLKIRPTSKQMTDKLAELMAAHVTDPAVILGALQNCAGTRNEWRLSRRKKRGVSAAAMAAAAVAAAAASATGKKKKKKKSVRTIRGGKTKTI